jgi:Cation/multidrug efflux pump
MLSAFCVKRPVFAIVLSLVIVIAGLVAMFNLPIAQYPELTPPQVTVTATYPGADSQTVADTVAAPIETQVNGVDNMIYMQSTSSPTGQMSLNVYFDTGTDPDIAQVQVQNRVSLALAQLPQSVQQNGVNVQKRSSSFLMLIAVYSPDGRYDQQYVGNYANLYVLDALETGAGREPGTDQWATRTLPCVSGSSLIEWQHSALPRRTCKTPWRVTTSNTAQAVSARRRVRAARC